MRELHHGDLKVVKLVMEFYHGSLEMMEFVLNSYTHVNL